MPTEELPLLVTSATEQPVLTGEEVNTALSADTQEAGCTTTFAYAAYARPVPYVATTVIESVRATPFSTIVFTKELLVE